MSIGDSNTYNGIYNNWINGSGAVTWITTPTTSTGTSATMTGMIGTTGTITYTGTTGVSYRVTGMGTPSYSDLMHNLRPGDRWFDAGASLKLDHDLYFYDRTGLQVRSLQKGTVLMYLGVHEDFEQAKERHMFLSSTGETVQYCYWIYDLGWRWNVKKNFSELT